MSYLWEQMERQKGLLAKESFLRRETSIEVAYGAIIVAAAAAYVSYDINAKAADRVPVAFSEVGKIIRAHPTRTDAPALTRFYAGTSDCVMKITESRNNARERNRSNETFASELEQRIDPALRTHWQLTDCARVIPQDAADALKVVDKYVQAAPDLQSVSAAFNQVWKYWRTDYEKTVYDYVQECDSQGKNCTTVRKPRQVYDYSIHHYRFDAAKAVHAYNQLGAYLAKHPDLKITEQLVTTQVTEAENEYAIEKSMKHALNGKIPSAVEALAYANRWATGSNFAVYAPQLNNGQSLLQLDHPAWKKALTTGRDADIRRETTFDDGPKEYQHALEITKRSNTMAQQAFAVTSGMRYAATVVPQMVGLVQNFVNIALDGKEGNANKARDVMWDTNLKIYKANFAAGFDLQPFKWFEVIGMTFLGGLVGGGLGYAVDRLMHRRRVQSQPRFK